MAIYCNRPQSASATIPASLLHSAFGKFIDDCENHMPTAEDNKLVLELSTVMSNFYADEGTRAQRIHSLFAEHGIHLMRTKIEDTKFETDGDISYKNFRLAIVEIKNDLGYTGAEASAQAILYYLESTRKQAPKMQESVLPCLLIVMFGSSHVVHSLQS